MGNKGNEIIDPDNSTPLFKKMKAIVCTKYGPPDVLQLREVEKPTPKDNEVLIKIHATTVTAGDCELRGLKFSFWLRNLMRLGFGFRRPRKKILGMELAGEIKSVGKDITLFKKGDQVFGTTGMSLGSYAEYICLREERRFGTLALKPNNMTYEEAAAVPIGGLEALYFLGKGNIQSGQKILIIGASGTIGTFAIQLAKYYGAEITAVGNPTSLEVMKSLGAAKVIDYTKEDFTNSGEIYDVIFDVVCKSPISDYKKSLKENGLLLLANTMLTRKTRGLGSSKKVIAVSASPKKEDLICLRELIEAGKIKTVIDRRYTLEQIPEAHSYVDKGQKTGNIVINVEES
ncbi:hypothetical protein LCGC14_2141910 [marine sediment metagenome]|uniref:Enoyl reductase (ER) domain-containing protein n=1 Tax=marine sediment metagenome TaxID=412755 RepID=A0A0F9DYF1_9ZZZZ